MKTLADILKFMRKLSEFEKRSAEKNFLVGRKKNNSPMTNNQK